MRFLVDANIPRSALDAFARSGHQADHVNDVGLKGAPDEQIARRAQETHAAIVTRDLDFADIRQYPPADYQGIIVMRLPDDVIARDIVKILERFLAHPEIAVRLPGRLAIVDTEHFRLRPGIE